MKISFQHKKKMLRKEIKKVENEKWEQKIHTHRRRS